MSKKLNQSSSNDVPYYRIKKGEDRGCYQLHRPSKCRLKFPVTNKPIHKCEVPKREQVTIFDCNGIRNMIIPKKESNYYPVVMHTSELDRLRKQAKIVTSEETIAAVTAHEKSIQKAAAESAMRKQKLKESQQKQPGEDTATGGDDPELKGPDQAAHQLSRAEMMRADALEGPKLCNRIILASKCHAIRDAQCMERELVKKEFTEEERRLDAIMEENRVAAEKRAKAEEDRRHELRLQNLSAIIEQIKAHETAKVMEAERVEEESIRMNQANIAMQIDEANKLKEKHAQMAKLKAMLDEGNAGILYYRQLQMEEDRINTLRINNFLKQKQEREDKFKAEADAMRLAKQKGTDHIAKAQKEEQALKEELEYIRNLKIQEDVEREYRRKEREAAIKKHNDLRDLHASRTAQINDIYRTIAREIAKDEQLFNNAARQNEESLAKEKEMQDRRKAIVERHRQEIMRQINEKERARVENRERTTNEGLALRMEQDLLMKHEKDVIRQKLKQMRDQKIPEKYVKEVEQTLGRHGFRI